MSNARNFKGKYVNASDIGGVTYCPVKKYYDKKHGLMDHEKSFMATKQTPHDRIINDRVRNPRGNSASVDNRCYIATHVYGMDAPQTNELRYFRDKYLMTSAVGRHLVTIYYRTSPHCVKYLSEHPRSNRIISQCVRLLLLPFVKGNKQ